MIDIWIVLAIVLFLMIPLVFGVITWLESDKWTAGLMASGLVILIQLVGIASFLLLMKG